MADVTWRMKGQYIKNCNCIATCPCDTVGFPHPDKGCEGMCGMHIVEGNFGDVPLSGLNCQRAKKGEPSRRHNQPSPLLLMAARTANAAAVAAGTSASANRSQSLRIGRSRVKNQARNMLVTRFEKAKSRGTRPWAKTNASR